MREHERKMWGVSRRLIAIAVVAMIAACSPIIRNHGFVPNEADLAAVSVGVDTRETVTEKIGPPTSGGVLDGSGFYYVASKFRHYGAFAPEEIDRQLLAISFASTGVVTNIQRFGLEDGRVVTLSRRVTDDNVQDNTFLRQLLGSIGRVDAGTFLGEN